MTKMPKWLVRWAVNYLIKHGSTEDHARIARLAATRKDVR